MSVPTVLVASRFLMDQRDTWNDGWELLGPEDIHTGLSAEAARHIQVVAADGDALDCTLVNALPNLKLVACFSTGYAGIDLGQLRARGVTLTTAAGINAHDVADHAIALMLAWWHRIPAMDRAVRDGKWRAALQPRVSLRGRRAGIAGLGRIGSQIAHRAEALGLSVSWWGPGEKTGSAYTRAADLPSLARESDILFIAMRATTVNSRQIDSTVLRELGPQGLLVNVSRGFVVDQPALIQALESGTIAGAALDVFAQEPVDGQMWRRFENVVLTPHIAGYTQEAGTQLFAQLRENIRRHFAGQPLLTPVNDSL